MQFFWFLQIGSIEMEKTAIQRNLDNVLELVNEQNISFREKYDEVKVLTTYHIFGKIVGKVSFCHIVISAVMLHKTGVFVYVWVIFS